MGFHRTRKRASVMQNKDFSRRRRRRFDEPPSAPPPEVASPESLPRRLQGDTKPRLEAPHAAISKSSDSSTIQSILPSSVAIGNLPDSTHRNCSESDTLVSNCLSCIKTLCNISKAMIYRSRLSHRLLSIFPKLSVPSYPLLTCYLSL